MKSYIKILFLLVITLVVLSLASCGNNVIELPESEDAQNGQANGEGEGENGSGAAECTHEFEEKVLVASTCQKEGISKKTCKLCGATENGIVLKAVHVEVIDPAIAATCTEPGKTEGAHCMNCNTVLKERETVEPLGHTEIIDEAIAAPFTPIPRGNMNTQSRNMFIKAGTTLHHMAYLGAPSRRMTKRPIIDHTIKTADGRRYTM